VVGIGCPGIIDKDGSIERGAQNLPGNWESSRFNLPRCICEEIPKIGDHDTVIVMHNDAVIQGLSQLPFMQELDQWWVLTIGTVSAMRGSPIAALRARTRPCSSPLEPLKSRPS
jgi:hypothetical protein